MKWLEGVNPVVQRIVLAVLTALAAWLGEVLEPIATVARVAGLGP